MPPVFNVCDFGATGEGKTMDSKAIQYAVEPCVPGLFESVGREAEAVGADGNVSSWPTLGGTSEKRGRIEIPGRGEEKGGEEEKRPLVRKLRFLNLKVHH